MGDVATRVALGSYMLTASASECDECDVLW